MYSSDREIALSRTISCLRRMNLYDQCQKTLIVDGKVNVLYPDWNVVEVPRIGDKFSWSYMWDAGVGSARFENVLYLDSDRLLPPNFIELVVDNLKEDTFVFTSNHFMMREEISQELCEQILDFRIEEIIENEEFLRHLKYEPRFKEPVHGPGKNVMSGSTAFTRKTYYRLGGVDDYYTGHGAFADTDFHYTARVGGCEFVDLGVPELHFPHPKLDKKRKGIGHMKLRKMGLDNFLYYCCKWNLPLALAENVAHGCDLRRPAKYVEERVKELGLTP